jgi:glycosyltransferase involved in cell wall biosynthesis
MKIAIFTDTFPPQVNGVARTFQRLESYLTTKNIEHRLFVPDTNGEDLFTSHVHRFKSIPFFLYPECRMAWPNMFHIRKQLEEFKPDLIHIATPFNIGLSGQYYGKKLHIPMVGSYHTHFDQYLQYYDLDVLSKWLWKYLNWFHRPFLKNFVPSQDTKQELAKRGFSNLEIWSRGVDCQLFHPQFDSEIMKRKYRINAKHVLVYVGRLAPEKELHVLMEIARHLPQRIKEQVHWLIVGDGPMKEELIKTSPENMSFTGYLTGESLTEVYAGSSLFIFPSTTETFGNVVLESLACGTPVIAARAGGVKEIIRDQVTGLLSSPGDPSEFIYHITELIENEQLLYKMKVEARKYALQQSWDSIFRKLVSDYESIIFQNQQKNYA